MYVVKPTEIKDATFNAFIQSSTAPVLIDFGAEWCPPCRAMEPVLELLATEMEDKVQIGKLDVDTNPETTARFGVRNLPTFIIFKNGQPVEKIVGAVPKTILAKRLENAV
jgi:thioredoxin 1